MEYYDREGNAYHLDFTDPVDRRLWEWLTDLDYRRVARDNVEGEEVSVSTVLLNLDQAPYGGGPPLIFETMVFGGDLDGECWRYSTEAEAVEGHARVVALVSLALAATK